MRRMFSEKQVKTIAAAQAADKQDKLIAGENITIAADGKTISASGGGGGVKYQHNIHSYGNEGAFAANYSFINDVATPYTSIADVRTAISALGFVTSASGNKYLAASGGYHTASKHGIVTGITIDANGMYVNFCAVDTTTSYMDDYYQAPASQVVSDTVVEC